MRLFVGVWPSPEVKAALAAIERRADPALRWTSPEQWHVTLRFLGEVADDDLAGVVDALAAVAAGHRSLMAELGPATRVLSGHVLVVPVAGLDDLGTAVIAATAEVGRPPDTRPFRGHLTLARARGRGRLPSGVAGTRLSGRWTVGELALIRSHLEPDGARYETLTTVALA